MPKDSLGGQHGLMREFGSVTAKVELMQERLTSMEARLEASDHTLVERMNSLQSDLQESILELHKNSNTVKSHSKMLLLLASASLAGGSTAASLALNLIGS